jgi:uncharacterized damage-inducible protein DinB
MAIRDALVAEFDHEMAVTRKVLERVDTTQLDWQPHEKSMSLGRLAVHVAEVPSWGPSILNDPVMDIDPGSYKPRTCSSVSELLAVFDGLLTKLRPILATKSDAELAGMWTFKMGGKEILAMPRTAAWRSLVMNHLIHHRGQLSVYLRMTGSKVPSLYGPSADEKS